MSPRIIGGALILAAAALLAAGCTSSADDSSAVQDEVLESPRVAIQITNNSPADFTVGSVDMSGGSWVADMEPIVDTNLQRDESASYALQAPVGSEAEAQLVLTGYGNPFPIEMVLDTDGQSQVTCGATQCQVNPVSLTDETLNEYRVTISAN